MALTKKNALIFQDQQSEAWCPFFFVFLGEVAASLEGQANHAPLSKESEILGFDQSSCQRIASILSPYWELGCRASPAS